jgi:phosphatidylglycerol:prolipoprotein diacylglycerol transferase
MIDPVIFSFTIGGITITLRWYGLLIMAGILAGSWITEREVRRRGMDTDFIWDALLVVLPAGVVGARLWYVLNDILGGGTRYLENPARILNIPEGGLHIFGAILLGGLAAYWLARERGVEILPLLDSVAPALLIGQAVARPANFINQELYGPPTSLPWGIPISPEHRLPPWDNLALYPAETTRFHPTFAYEMIWNLTTASLLLWAVRRYSQRVQPGAVFAAWLVLAGVGRFLIEFFRPDQPRLPGTDLSYSRIISALMAVAGLIWLYRLYAPTVLTNK